MCPLVLSVILIYSFILWKSTIVSILPIVCYTDLSMISHTPVSYLLDKLYAMNPF